MNFRTKSVSTLLICGLAPVIVGDAFGWSLWLRILVPTTVLSGVALLLVLNHSGPARRNGSQFEEDPPTVPETPAEPPYREFYLSEVMLPSSMADYDFIFSATVWWRPAQGYSRTSDSYLPNLARASILNRARAITGQEHPSRSEFVRYLLDGALGSPGLDESASVTALATDARLDLAHADRERLQEIAGLRKAEQAWEQQRQYERNKRAYLGDEVLKTPGSAVVWWLARHDDEVEKAVEMIGPLAQIAAAANDTEVPELFQHLVAPADVPIGNCDYPEHHGQAGIYFSPGTGNPGTGDKAVDHLSGWLDECGLAEGSDERAVFAHRIARLQESASRSATADRSGQGFTDQASDPSSDRPSEADGEFATGSSLPTDPAATENIADVGPDSEYDSGGVQEEKQEEKKEEEREDPGEPGIYDSTGLLGGTGSPADRPDASSTETGREWWDQTRDGK
ncbi:hypothetical protein ACIOEX_20840 [Streptomyces sp. NPDC087850]|uniref:hypothetical protein n=1 Tax=Streptomyces sp. NPDC087850 TaxID=3365809 RepID=UPI0037F22A96